jgi:predicted DNA-binding ribbon-helix-helix protein
MGRRSVVQETISTQSRTILVHNDGMGVATKTVRQSLSLPAGVATKVRRMAKTRKLSANRLLVELIEHGIEAEARKEKEFFELAKRFRAASAPADVKRLGNELGRMIFG